MASETILSFVLRLSRSQNCIIKFEVNKGNAIVADLVAHNSLPRIIPVLFVCCYHGAALNFDRSIHTDARTFTYFGWAHIVSYRRASSR